MIIHAGWSYAGEKSSPEHKKARLNELTDTYTIKHKQKEKNVFIA
jgi:hypothetical protein